MHRSDLDDSGAAHFLTVACASMVSWDHNPKTARLITAALLVSAVCFAVLPMVSILTLLIRYIVLIKGMTFARRSTRCKSGTC